MEFEFIAAWNSSNFNLSNIIFDESSSMVVQELIISTVCLAGILANGLIIYILLCSNKFKAPTDAYILNWAIADLAYLLITPCFYRIYAALEKFFITEEVFCIAIEMATIFQIATIIFIWVLCVIWIINLFTPYQGEYNKYILIFIWTVCFILIMVFSMFCIHDILHLASHYLTSCGYSALLVMVIVMHAIKFYRKCKNIKPHDKSIFITSITTAYVVCCLPSWTCILLLSLVKYLSEVAASLSYINSIVNVIIMYKFNRHFKTSIQKMFRCDTTGYVDAADSLEESDEVADRSYLKVTSDLQNAV